MPASPTSADTPPRNGDFSSTNFHRFQQLLHKQTSGTGLLWDLRDGLFSVVFNYTIPYKSLLLSRDCTLLMPGGWITWILLRVIHGAFTGSSRVRPGSASEKAHFLFLSDRSNHLKRMLPFMKDLSQSIACRGWVNRRSVLAHLPQDSLPAFTYIEEHWVHHLKLRHVVAAMRASRQLKKGFSTQTDRIKLALCAIHLLKFLCWRDFWRIQFKDTRPEWIICTYEKEAVSKAMFAAARECQVPRRIHWAHSLRHGSIQATLATELWCMTELDVDYFKPLLPHGCTPVYRENPESAELRRSIGVLDESVFNSQQPRRFLFLGSGLDAAYTREQSEADMGVLRKAMDCFGDRIEWRFRPHPGNIQAFRQDLDAVGLNHIELSNAPLNEDLAWAHGVGSTFSSVLVDIKSTGRRIFWVHDEIRELYGVDELIHGGFGIHLSSDNVVQNICRAFNIQPA